MEETIHRGTIKSKIPAQIRPLIEPLAPFAALLLLWAFVTYAGVIDPVFLPTPDRVLASFIDLASGEFVLNHLVPSAFRVIAAFVLSVAIAFPLGTISGQVPWVEKMLHPLFGFTRYLPVASLVPLSILWFGIGDAQKIAVITIGVVFQLVLLLAYDSASVPKELIEAGRTFGLTRCPDSSGASWCHSRCRQYGITCESLRAGPGRTWCSPSWSRATRAWVISSFNRSAICRPTKCSRAFCSSASSA